MVKALNKALLLVLVFVMILAPLSGMSVTAVDYTPEDNFIIRIEGGEVDENGEVWLELYFDNIIGARKYMKDFFTKEGWGWNDAWFRGIVLFGVCVDFDLENFEIVKQGTKSEKGPVLQNTSFWFDYRMVPLSMVPSGVQKTPAGILANGNGFETITNNGLLARFKFQVKEGANPAPGAYPVTLTDWKKDITVRAVKPSGELDDRTLLRSMISLENSYFTVKGKVTVENDGNGTASANPALASAGETVNLTARPNSGYRFKEWQVISGGPLAITGNSFTMPDDHVTVKAIFEESEGVDLTGRVYPVVNWFGADEFNASFTPGIYLKTSAFGEIVAAASITSYDNPDTNYAEAEFIFRDVPHGDYVLEIKRPGYLIRWMKVSVDAGTSVITALDEDTDVFKLIAGDVDGSTEIDSTEIDASDVSTIASNFRAAYGGSGYNVKYDLDGTGEVDASDYSIVTSSFRKSSVDYPGAIEALEYLPHTN